MKELVSDGGEKSFWDFSPVSRLREFTSNWLDGMQVVASCERRFVAESN